MDSLLLVVICIVIFALIFDFINGFHDTANAIATSVSTKALPPRRAIMLAASMNFLGALTFTGVAQTITSGIANPFDLENGTTVILAALIAAIIWNLVTWVFGIPSSSSHAIIGAIAGSVIASDGFNAVQYSGFISIIEGLLASPLIAFVAGYIIYTIIKIVFKNRNLAKTNKQFRRVQILTAAVQSYAHGTNDAQKSMGIITMALIVGGMHTTTDVPFWVQFSCATAMALGTSVGGWRIIKTVGGKIMKIRPVNGVAADVTGAATILGATLIHLPVSTTHVISSAIMGVGASHRVKGVNWGTAQRMIVTWVITLPVTALLGAIIFTGLQLLPFL
ncbi:putative low-affinity inorganic phosphate transporter [Lentibacillus sp. JNUCC-1]|uniref:inorganic phosphate transporter n=1 Tax=Lentibacillus sp. JNUCC-1 TaxID=2654513 RepID=UPI0012E95311|nr:inorganic phosphate transporter [Lentibacillus sp. JNUCC-1]MUV36937.1 putative low-affinity inorganic phosphate transporter [Lentibacillus sp. JNUCC-1]